MGRKNYKAEEIIVKLREIEIKCKQGKNSSGSSTSS